MNRLVAPFVVLLTAAASVACGGPDDPPGAGGGADWPAASELVATTGLVWETGGVVHLADGAEVDLGTDPAGYVVGGGGAVFVPEGEDAVMVATPDGVVETGAEADPETLRVSPDGRYLLFLDTTTGDVGAGETPVIQTVVVDLETGDELVRTSEGMGDPDEDDLANLYEDADPGVFGFTDDAAYVSTAGGWLSVDLDGGEVSAGSSPGEEPWFEEISGAGDRALVSPDGAWTIVPYADDRPDRIVARGGGPDVVPRYADGALAVNSWLDDRTAIGVADAGGGLVLLECPVPSGDCEPVPGTEDGVSLPIDRQGYDPAYVRTPG